MPSGKPRTGPGRCTPASGKLLRVQKRQNPVFYRWERTHPTDTQWKPMGLAMDADPELGETPGGLQAPHVVKLGEDDFYLFKTQTYGRYDGENDDIRNRGVPQTSVYHSKDPKMFGIDQDEEYFIGHLPVAAPEIVLYKGQYYIFALKLGSLEGMRCTKLKWVEK